MLSDLEAQSLIIAAIQRATGSQPGWSEIFAAQAVGRHEGSYGAGWQSALGKTSNNWGAVQCGTVADASNECPPGCFPSRDSRPTDHGQVGYNACFVIYTTPADGAEGLVRQLWRRRGVPEAARRGDLTALAGAMYDTHYFEGFGSSQDAARQGFASARDLRVYGYAKSLMAACDTIAKNTGRPNPCFLTDPRTGAGSSSGGSGGALALGLGALAAVGVGAYLALGRRRR